MTIDTELTWRHHVSGLGWQENYALSVEPAGVGLGYQLAMLERHGLKACFFVDPMPARLFGIAPVRWMVDTILEAGQEVQLHLHPMWERARANGTVAKDTVFELIDHPLDKQRELIEEARELLVEAGAPDPVAFRAGSYAVNDDSLRALAQTGIRYDASHNGCEGPWPSALSLPLEQVAPVDHHGVIEVPVSQLRTANGGLRHLQICAVSLAEMVHALDHAIAEDHPVFMPVGHSFELATRDGRRVNPVVRKRFDGLCALLAARRDAAPTMHFADLGALPLDRDIAPVDTSPTLVAGRMVGQLWANIVEKRAA
ncbi:polysaccharide deacetylase [Parasphingopyxis algicola]|uniref:polysaccharide deacetylase n=1 Tax=Parasphingopyxis algicola TaxID=2026624 RepID=UPI001FE91CD0|nr:polysaccharide deacetylase [Parasphingopyxis algicola]